MGAWPGSGLLDDKNCPKNDNLVGLAALKGGTQCVLLWHECHPPLDQGHASDNIGVGERQRLHGGRELNFDYGTWHELAKGRSRARLLASANNPIGKTLGSERHPAMAPARRIFHGESNAIAPQCLKALK